MEVAAERALGLPQIGDVVGEATCELADNVSYAGALYVGSCTGLVQQR